MLSKTSLMMVRGITLIPGKVAALLKGKAGEVGVYLYALGTLQGYSKNNLEWMSRQMCLETAHGTSNGMINRNNAFGMSCVSVRQNTQIGCEEVSPVETQGVYSNLWSSVVDRFMWDDYWGVDSAKSADDYPQRVSAIYHASGTYVDNVSATAPTGFRIAVVATWLALPLEILAIQKLWKYFQN
jgi:hypothetical protein